jgi:hypothetical protein
MCEKFGKEKLGIGEEREKILEGLCESLLIGAVLRERERIMKDDRVSVFEKSASKSCTASVGYGYETVSHDNKDWEWKYNCRLEK